MDLVKSRGGLLYLFSRASVDPGWFNVIVDSGFSLASSVTSLSPLSNAMGSTASTVVGSSLTGGQYLSAQAFELAPAQPRTGTPPSFLAKIRDALEDFAKRVWEHIKAKFKSDPTKTWIDRAGDWWPRVTTVINVILSQVASKAAPYFSGAVDIANGVVKTIKECFNRYRAYSLGDTIQINEGHPSAIVASIELAMNFAIGKGLWDTMKGAVSMGTDAAAPGAGAIFSLVASGCEVIAKVIHRLWETSGMRAFFTDCRDRYLAYSAVQTRVNENKYVPNAGAGDDGNFYSGISFGAWYRAAAYAIPCLSSLALCSGITGDKMMYLRMFEDEPLTALMSPAELKRAQDTFGRGVAYIDHLKQWSHQYLVDSGYKFQSNDPKDTMIANILKASTESKIPPLADIRTPLTVGRPNTLLTNLNGYDRSNLISLSAARAKFGGTSGTV
jgi:hypothetical protein